MKKQFSLTNKLLVPAILGFVILIIGFNSFVILNPGQAGVITILGKARDGVLLEGIHFKPTLVSAVDI
jgi:regulator of protease activity HflC (stomatin/prohibitin superfamily)